MTEERVPIITSLLDLDFYKMTMAQIAFKHFRDIPVEYAFTNRTIDVKLEDYIELDYLMYEIENIKSLRFTDDDLSYLEESEYIKKGLFGLDFLDFLKNLKLSGITVKKNGHSFEIRIKGNWPDVIFWETLVLSVLNELYNRSLLSRFDDDLISLIYEDGKKRLYRKTARIKGSLVQISEFGTRRRFAKWWQKNVLGILLKEVPENIVGTSNIALAKEFGTPPNGTFAHEMYMIFSGIFRDDLKGSHNKVLQYWEDQYGEYGPKFLKALSDTYGLDFFLRDMTKEQALRWGGLREDSGDPFECGDKIIDFYRSYGIEPMLKTIVFSDGLDIDKIFRLYNYFDGRIKTEPFGWGTNLTNDLGFKPLSLVIKAVWANGHNTVKLSNNIAKAIGNTEEDIELFKKTFDYHGKFNEQCVY